jgi:hypothetical protein
MSSSWTVGARPIHYAARYPASTSPGTRAVPVVPAALLRRPIRGLAVIAGAVLSVLALALLLRGSPAWLVRDADARMWHPGDGFDLSAGRALVEGLEVAAAALGLVGKLRLATMIAALCGLVLCLLHA